MRQLGGTEADVRKLLRLKATSYAKELGTAVLDKDLRVCFFNRDNEVKDISKLSPSAEEAAEAEWGGLVGWKEGAPQ